MKLKLLVLLVATFSLHAMKEAEQLLAQFQDPKIFEQPLDLKKKIDTCAQELGNNAGIIQEMRALYDAQEIIEVQDALKKAGFDTDYSNIVNINNHPQTDDVRENLSLLQRSVDAKLPSPDLVRILLRWGADPNQCESSAYHPLYIILSKKLTSTRTEILKILIPLTDHHKLTTPHGEPLLASILIPSSPLAREFKLSLIEHASDDIITKLCAETLFYGFIIKPQLLPGCDSHQVQQAVLARKRLIEEKEQSSNQNTTNQKLKIPDLNAIA